MKHFLSALTLAAGILHAGTASAVPILWTGNGHYYDLVNTVQTWNTAVINADTSTFDPDGAGGQPALDGYLVTITSAAEDTFLSTSFGGSTSFWTAGSDAAVEGVWRWVSGPETGSLLTFFDWGAGEPNNSLNQDALLANWVFTPGLWDDQSVTSAFRYVVEYSSSEASTVPEPLALLLLGTGLMALARRAGGAASRKTSQPLPSPGTGAIHESLKSGTIVVPGSGLRMST